MTTAQITEFEVLMAEQYLELTQAGTWWSSEQQVSIAATTRAALYEYDDPGLLPDHEARIVAKVANAPASIRRADIDALAGQGVRPEAYAELVGLVARLTAFDAAAFGLGLDLPALPDPGPGEASHSVVADADETDSWVPMTGPGDEVTALSSVPGATEQWSEISSLLYLAPWAMAEPDLILDGLSRAQVELVAARTSRLDACTHGLVTHTRMLRDNVAHQGAEVDLGVIVTGVGECGIPSADEILALTDAVVLRDVAEFPDARIRAEIRLGRRSADRVVMVAACTLMMNRILGAVGVPIPN